MRALALMLAFLSGLALGFAHGRQGTVRAAQVWQEHLSDFRAHYDWRYTRPEDDERFQWIAACESDLIPLSRGW